MLTVHHLNNSRSFRIVWLCEELGLDYKLVQHTRDKETLRAPDSLKKIHPLGKAPVIEHDGQTIAETDAIIHYICNKIAGGRLSHGEIRFFGRRYKPDVDAGVQRSPWSSTLAAEGSGVSQAYERTGRL